MTSARSYPPPVAPNSDLDLRVRLAAFACVDQLQRSAGSELLTREQLGQGFVFEGQRVPLVSPRQGIFKPKILPRIPLSILTSAVVEGKPRPYDDVIGEDGMLTYRYQGTDVNRWDNVGLREAMRLQTPLIYFQGILPGRYVASYPVFIVADDPSQLAFSVSVDDRQFASLGNVDVLQPETAIRRRYATRQVRQRVHQREFRERVLEAYSRHCAVCRLKRDELLDAAHIIGDTDVAGDAIVSNGIALCKLHHSAFDANIMGVTPDYVIEIREDVLEEVDGPMLIHGLQGWNGQHLRLPKRSIYKPDPARLQVRYDAFRAVRL